MKKRIFQIVILLLATDCTHAQSASLLRNQVATEDLHTKALKQGEFHTTMDLPDSWVVARDLKQLTSESSIVLVVDVISNRCELSSDGRGIFTRYQAKVVEVLADDFATKQKNHLGEPNWQEANAGRTSAIKDELVNITLAGGKIGFKDGSSAQVDVLNVPRLLNKHRYLLYLHYSRSLRSFVPMNLSRGMFEVQNDGSSLHWMVVEKSSKGYRLQPGNYSDTLQVAREHGAQKSAAASQ